MYSYILGLAEKKQSNITHTRSEEFLLIWISTRNLKLSRGYTCRRSGVFLGKESGGNAFPPNSKNISILQELIMKFQKTKSCDVFGPPQNSILQPPLWVDRTRKT